MTLEATLREQFGVSEFRAGQKEAVDALLAGRDCVVVLATGSGKSLIYQLPPVLGARGRDVSVVVSPLISLMTDQVEQLRARGIPAVYLAHTLGQAAERDAVARISVGAFRVVYVTPERAVASAGSAWGMALAQLKAAGRIALFAVDEAHAISEWGADFRPDYRRLSCLRESCPGVPIVALTATATAAVQRDIVEQLRLVDPLRVIGSFDRPNLFYSCREKSPGGMAADLAFLAEPPVDPAIVYVPSIQATEDACAVLRSAGVPCGPYNSSLSPEQRTDIHRRFLSGELRVVVATVAFGMGIDKPDVRNVVHYGPPRSLEAYFQQSGRAGRDGRPARCTMFWLPADFGKAGFVTNMSPSSEERARMRVLLAHVRDFCADRALCRRRLLLDYFGETLQVPHPPESCCDNCVSGKCETHDFASEARQLLSAVKRAGPHHGVKKAIKETLVAVGRKHTTPWWEELGLRLKRAGLLEERRSGEFVVTDVSAAGNVALTTDEPIMLPVTPRLATEMHGFAPAARGSDSISPPISALHAVPRIDDQPTSRIRSDGPAAEEDEVPLRSGRSLPPSLLSMGSYRGAAKTRQRICQPISFMPVPLSQKANVMPPLVLTPPPAKRQCQQPQSPLSFDSPATVVFERLHEARASSRKDPSQFMRFIHHPDSQPLC